MPRLRLSTLLCLLIAVLTVVPSLAQEEQPLVVFVVGPDFNTASLTDMGDSGISRLGQIFLSLGARVEFNELNRPISEEAALLVIIRPLRQFSLPQVARIWLHLRHGKNLLLAVDPENYYLGTTNVNAQITRTGLTSLLASDYGIVVQDSFLVEPWFTEESISNLETNTSRVYSDSVPNPITEPLAAFNIPVWVWGSRHLRVEPFGINSLAVPLLYSSDAYGEANREVFRTAQGETFLPPNAPLEVNLDRDFLGLLTMAAFAENTEVGSRIVIVGDSEIFQNGYGLAMTGDNPTYVGNRIFVDRVAAWLLDLPVDQWPPLPDGYTWITIDGSADDWGNRAAVVDTEDQVDLAEQDIQQVRVFSDNINTYLLVETSAQPDPNLQVNLQVDVTGDGIADETIIASVEGLTLQDSSGVEEAMIGGDAAVGQTIEMRFPLRAASSAASIVQLCFSVISPQPDAGVFDCLGTPIIIPQQNVLAPNEVASEGGMPVTVSSSSSVVNLSAGPDVNFPTIATIANGTTLDAVGRNTVGDWIQVQNAALRGWLPVSSLTISGDSSALPITDGLPDAEATPSVEVSTALSTADGLAVTIGGANVNLRANPTTDSQVLTVLAPASELTAIGRTGDGTWTQVQSGANTGWVSSPLLVPNPDLQTLPVVANPTPSDA